MKGVCLFDVLESVSMSAYFIDMAFAAMIENV